ncbi:hypothetical protein V6N13_113051 [Hibiscus sabdariffa]|uniref:Uncharacterized protein n=1 Tax=Hibiscus sabdariffa TaxID=183260 RepID=A0ABR2CTF5_9ROSI
MQIRHSMNPFLCVVLAWFQRLSHSNVQRHATMAATISGRVQQGLQLWSPPLLAGLRAMQIGPSEQGLVVQNVGEFYEIIMGSG